MSHTPYKGKPSLVSTPHRVISKRRTDTPQNPSSVKSLRKRKSDGAKGNGTPRRAEFKTPESNRIKWNDSTKKSGLSAQKSQSTGRKRKLGSIPDFSKLHQKLFSEMKSIDNYVTVRDSAKKSKPVMEEVILNAPALNCSVGVQCDFENDIGEQHSFERMALTASVFKFTAKSSNESQGAVPKKKGKENYQNTAPQMKDRKKRINKEDVKKIPAKAATSEGRRARNRDFIKGVRANRQFSLLMKQRGINIDAD